jgi:hypothetical protein
LVPPNNFVFVCIGLPEGEPANVASDNWCTQNLTGAYNKSTKNLAKYSIVKEALTNAENLIKKFTIVRNKKSRRH